MYNKQKAACCKYQKNDLANLTPLQIIARLYQALEHDLNLAHDALAGKDRAVQGEKISHALAIIGELQANLDLEKGGEIAANLSDLYIYLVAEITMANVNNDPTGLEKALHTVTPLTEAWVELVRQKNEPEHVQRVRGAGSREKLRAVAFQATF
jgi:flagellar protein FliS